MNSPYIVRSAHDAAAVLAAFPRHHKLRSWAALHLLGLPTVDGVVVTEWERSTAGAVAAFAEELGSDDLLLRSDQDLETGHSPRGGYLVSVSDPEPILEVLRQGRVAFLLEPLSPFSDLYSVGVLVWPGEPVVVEVVGPGFDASDLKRGGTSPHERMKIDPVSWKVTSHAVVAPARYLESWRRRLVRVGWLLLMDSDLTDEQNAEYARLWLEESGERLLLDAEQTYAPIPKELALEVARTTASLETDLARLHLPRSPYMTSMSLVAPQRQVYWDIVWPSLKYEGVRES